MRTSTLQIFSCILFFLSFFVGQAYAQAPQKLNYQAVIFDTDNALIKNTAIGMQISILHNSSSGDIVFQEVYYPNPITNGNGVVTVEIGTGNAIIGVFSSIDWSSGTYFIKSETDITGGTNYLIIGTSQIISTPYALYANKSGDGFSGNYLDLTNKPIIDGTETKIEAGNNINVTGTGSPENPYIISALTSAGVSNSQAVYTSSQSVVIPGGVSKIKVELWGGAGGGGGGGAYSYSYNLLSGGSGGGGGFACQTFNVVTGQQFDLVVGAGGVAGNNAVFSGGNYTGDTDGGNGGNTQFNSMKAAGGKGGKRGSYGYYTINGEPGLDNIGTINAHSSSGGSNLLDIYNGIARAYIAERRLTSMPGTGGSLSGYSIPGTGEGGCAIITFFE